MLGRLLSVAALVLVSAVAAMAQTPLGSVDFARWDGITARAEIVIRAENTSDTVLNDLRSELVDWRTRFADAQSVNSTRIETVQSQIQALGPQPAENETESEALASQRSELEAQLSELLAPRQIAEVANSKATGLIAEIDALLRERQTQAFFEVGPSPLSPTGLAGAFAELGGTAQVIRDELATSWATPSERVMARENRPLIVILLVLAAALILRGRALMERLSLGIYSRTGRGRGIGGFVVSLGQVLAPVLGLVVLNEVAKLTGFFGPRGTEVLAALPLLGAILFGGRWLGTKVFPPSDDMGAVFALDSGLRREGRLLAAALGVILSLDLALLTLLSVSDQADALLPVLRFPLYLALGVILFLLGRLMLRAAAAGNAATDDEEGQTFRAQLAVLSGRALMVLAVIIPLLSATGYGRAAHDIGIPLIQTLALLAFLATLMVVVRDLFELIAGTEVAPDAPMPLTPLLINYGMVLATLPVLALIWGARVADLTELWAQFSSGFAVGDARLTPSDALTALAVFLLGLGATRMVQRALRTSVLPRTRIALGGRTAITSGVGYVGVFVAVIIAITAAGIDLSNLALVAGALSVGIGFGLQNIVSNFVSGIILLIERPISNGDMIQVGDQTGYVREISVRSTRIETFDRTDVIVPNADLISGTVTNLTRGNMLSRLILPIGVAYGSDTRRVEAILAEIVAEHPLIVQNPPAAVLFTAFGASSLDFEIRAIVRDVTYIFVVRSELNHRIAERFAAEGIEIPFPQQDVWLRTAPPAESVELSHVGGQATGGSGARNADLPDTSDAPDAESN